MTEKKTSRIDENTTITLGILTLIIVGVVRVETTSFKANANEEKISELEKKNQEYVKVITDVRMSLVQIKTKMGIPLNEIQESTGR